MRCYFLALGTLLVVCVGCAVDGQQLVDKGEFHAPPAAFLANPGPAVDGPGPAVMQQLTPPIQQASHSMPAPGGPGPMMGPMGPMMGAAPFPLKKSQISFLMPEGVSIGWQTPQGFAENQLMSGNRYNFVQAQTYRLKLTNFPGRPGLEVYPTLEVYPAHPMTDSYLSHNSIPMQLTDEDLDQVETNNFVTKVVYLPEQKFQELAIAGVETLISTQLPPGVDPVSEADQRGTIMAVMRVGNMDLEMPSHVDGVTAIEDGRGVTLTNYEAKVDGNEGQHIPPMPIAPAGTPSAVPGTPLMGGPSYPGMPPSPLVAGMTAQKWGMPRTATPIGLPGPPHIPLGGNPSLKSHTIINNTKMELPDPVDHFAISVKHQPGYRLPAPVRHVEYTEKHPVYSPGELAYPQNMGPAGVGPGYTPPMSHHGFGH